MKYNEWVTQLNANLLGVSDAERRRVLDYYAEAYADRRAAGFSENEIIDGFGAPYDAAQAILDGDNSEKVENSDKNSTYSGKMKDSGNFKDTQTNSSDNFSGAQPPPGNSYAPPPPHAYKQPKEETKNDYTWVFVILCIIFAGPLFGLTMGMVGITIGFAAAPFALLVSGAAGIVQGFIEIFTSGLGAGIIDIGLSLIILGLGIALANVFFTAVKWMWKLFNKFFKWLAGLFKGESK